MRSEIVHMIRLHEGGKADEVAPVSNSKIKGLLMRHDDVCPLWPGVAHLLHQQRRKDVCTFPGISVVPQ